MNNRLVVSVPELFFSHTIIEFGEGGHVDFGKALPIVLVCPSLVHCSYVVERVIRNHDVTLHVNVDRGATPMNIALFLEVTCEEGFQLLPTDYEILTSMSGSSRKPFTTACASIMVGQVVDIPEKSLPRVIENMGHAGEFCAVIGYAVRPGQVAIFPDRGIVFRTKEVSVEPYATFRQKVLGLKS